MTKSNNANRGFNLIEVCLSIGILAIIMTGVWYWSQGQGRAAKELQSEALVTQLNRELNIALLRDLSCQCNIINPLPVAAPQHFLVSSLTSATPPSFSFPKLSLYDNSGACLAANVLRDVVVTGSVGPPGSISVTSINLQDFKRINDGAYLANLVFQYQSVLPTGLGEVHTLIKHIQLATTTTPSGADKIIRLMGCGYATGSSFNPIEGIKGVSNSVMDCVEATRTPPTTLPSPTPTVDPGPAVSAGFTGKVNNFYYYTKTNGQGCGTDATNSNQCPKWGLACTNGYKLNGCWISGGSAATKNFGDTMPTEKFAQLVTSDGCYTDNDEWNNRLTINVVCCKVVNP